jgi:TetR/AcrR family transcriptional repressor of nem operon
MSKGDNTRRHIVMKSAELFNQRGFAGSSLSDITEITGIKKGGIYRYFHNKDEIAFEAFDYARSVVGQHFTQAMHNKETAYDKLLAFFHAYENVVEHPPFIGGCPLLNTATDSDDTHPELRNKAQQALNSTLRWMKDIIQQGIHTGEFKKDIDIDVLATFTLSTLEGGIMLSRLDQDNKHIRNNMQSFSAYLEQCCLNTRSARKPIPPTETEC